MKSLGPVLSWCICGSVLLPSGTWSFLLLQISSSLGSSPKHVSSSCLPRPFGCSLEAILISRIFGDISGGFPHSSVGNESTFNAGDLGSIPGLGISLREGNGNRLQYSCLEHPRDRGAQRATVHGITRLGHDLATKPPTTTKWQW